MSKTAVKKLFCKSCSADVREASAFCYNCGESVSGGRFDQIRNHSNLSKTGQAENITEPVISNEKHVESEYTNAKLQTATDAKAEKITKLESVPALRRRTKAFKRKPVEVVWVERGDSAIVFVIVSAALTLFALLLLFLAFYLR